MKTTEVAVQKFPWDLVQQVTLARILELIAQKHGYHVAIGGGCVMSGSSEKDCDILFYVSKTKEPFSIEDLYLDLSLFFEDMSSDWEYHDNDDKIVFKARYKQKRVDVFILHSLYRDNELAFKQRMEDKGA